jgi:MYXO-CTERM domain-containing protein
MGKRWTWVLALGLVAWAGEASAKPIYKTAVPNAAVHDCDTCHIPNDPQDARNLFGQELQPLADANEPLDTWWDQVKELDSDADGQTNAQELGDPCLEWTTQVPAGRTFDISNPGDPASLSASPDVCEDPPLEGEGGGGGGGHGSGSGNGDGSGMGDGSGSGMGDGSGQGGAQPEPSNNASERPGEPDFSVAQPHQGCASIAGEGDAGDAGWVLLALMALGLVRRRS